MSSYDELDAPAGTSTSSSSSSSRSSSRRRGRALPPRSSVRSAGLVATSPATVGTGMSTTQAQRLIVMAGVVEVGLVLAAGRAHLVPGSTFSRLFAVAALATGLAMAAEVTPQVAGPFALLVLVAMGVRYRGAFGSVIARTSSGAAPAARAPARAPARPAAPAPAPATTGGKKK